MHTTQFPHKVETIPRVVGFRCELATIHGRRFEAEVERVAYGLPVLRDVTNHCLVILGEVKGWRHVAP